MSTKGNLESKAGLPGFLAHALPYMGKEIYPEICMLKNEYMHTWGV